MSYVSSCNSLPLTVTDGQTDRIETGVPFFQNAPKTLIQSLEDNYCRFINSIVDQFKPTTNVTK